MQPIKPFYVRAKKCTEQQLWDIVFWIAKAGGVMVETPENRKVTLHTWKYFGMISRNCSSNFSDFSEDYGTDAVELEYHQVREHLGLDQHAQQEKETFTDDNTKCKLDRLTFSVPHEEFEEFCQALSVLTKYLVK